MSLKTSVLLSALSLLTTVRAHGIVTGVVADGKYFQGYDPSFQYQQNPPKVAGWTAPLTQDRGFVGPDKYGNPDIICHKSATPGQAYIQVSAGGTLELQWTEWPESHHGPVLDYLAPCNGECTTVDKTSLEFTKIDEGGLNSWNSQPGDWAADDLLRNNNTWVLTLPSSIAPGKYVLRHEIIALHAAHEANGAQNYPQCLNLEVSGSGTNSLSSGTPATELYSSTDPGIFINIYNKLTGYVIPGPPVMEGGDSDTPAPSTSASSSSAAVSITATPTTDIAIPSGEPSSPIYPIPDNSTVTTATPSYTGTGSPWEDWGTSAPATSTASTPADATTATGTPAPTDYPTEEPEEPENPEEPEEPETPEPTTTSPPTSFSSTVTGRVGKPTKFVCYVEE